METNKKEHTFISAVVYVHNAEKRIESFLKTLSEVLTTNFMNSEIVLVDDASTDDSAKKIKAFAKTTSSLSISLISMSYFHGLEASMTAGTDLAIGDYVLEFDTTVVDYNPNEIMEIYRTSLSGYDIVCASPNKKEKFSSRLFYSFYEKNSKNQARLSTETFRIITRRAINRIASINIAIIYRKALYSNSGLKVKNYKYEPVVVSGTISDKLENSYRSSLAIDSLILFTEFGYKFSITMTFIMMFMSIFMVLYSVITYLLLHPVEGWTTTILFLSVAFFGLFGILTIIIKYLQLIVNLVFKRKHYSFSSIEKLN